MNTSELRVHGVSGTPPRDILFTDPVEVAEEADGDLRVYRKAHRDSGFDVSAYHWGGLTARSRWTALWILLGPFALANTAGWMTKRHTRPVRATVRLAALGLTALFADQASKTLIHLPDHRLVEMGVSWRPVAVAGLGALTGLGLVALVALVALRSHFNVTSIASNLRLVFGLTPMSMIRSMAEGGPQPHATETVWGDPSGECGLVDDEMWSMQPLLQRLMRAHLAAALAMVAIDLSSWSAATWSWPVSALAMLAAVLGVVLLTSAPESPVIIWWTTLVPHVSLAALVAVVVGVALTGQRAEPSVHSVTLGLVVLLGVAIFASGLFAGTRVMGALVLAVVFGAILGMIAGLAMEGVLGLEPVLVPNGAGWVAVAMLFLLGTLALAAFVLMATGRTDPPGVGPDLSVDAADEQNGSKGLRRAQFILRRVTQRLSSLLTVSAWFGAGLSTLVIGRLALRSRDQGAFVFDPAVLGTPGDSRPVEVAAIVMGVVLVVCLVGFVGVCWGWKGAVATMVGVAVVVYLARTGRLSADFLGIRGRTDDGIVELAVLVAVLIPGSFMLRSVIAGLRPGQESGERRRKVGILWDVSTFWPRWYQPLGPPAYGPLVVTGLTQRLMQHPVDILSAHSQGSLISAVVMARMRPEDRPSAFMSYGSQLGVLYPDAFPDVGLDDVRRRLAYAMPGRWRNLWRITDPIGGQVIPELGDDNVQVTEGAGHSGYEITSTFAEQRESAIDTPRVIVDVRDETRV